MISILKHGFRIAECCCVVILLALGVAPALALEGMIGIHDPSTVIQCDGNYYVFGTGRGISVLTSSNGFDWQRGGIALQPFPGDDTQRWVITTP